VQRSTAFFIPHSDQEEMMSKRILVPLDRSKLAEIVLPHAVAYARANKSCGPWALTLLRVAVLPGPLSSTAWGVAPATNISEGWDEELNDESRYLETVAGRIRSEGIEVQIELLEDEPASGIISYVEQHPDVSLIAMSTHGRSGLSRWVFGSVAEKVLHASPVPLLLVRPKPGEELSLDFQVPKYRSLLVALDGSIFAAQALDTAKTLASTLHTTLTLVSAVPEQPIAAGLLAPPAAPPEWVDESAALAGYLQRNRRNLEGEGFSVDTRLEYGPPAEAILRAAGASHADLIVMATHGRTGLPRLWLGSIAMKVVQASARPVLLVRAKERIKEAEPKRVRMAAIIASAT
jgi:nucleotide-binding universal stress UspA family protein